MRTLPADFDGMLDFLADFERNDYSTGPESNVNAEAPLQQFCDRSPSGSDGEDGEWREVSPPVRREGGDPGDRAGWTTPVSL
jgi:hypothetical protein